MYWKNAAATVEALKAGIQQANIISMSYNKSLDMAERVLTKVSITY